ncbi:hypothetical protein NHH82_27650 [Oxalobacteraceae bacterium OTU3REALA1]|nr:hypothetical protein NHH82_27650 [Oxalobacteraceae bacterium OTU3REALA1]
MALLLTQAAVAAQLVLQCLLRYPDEKQLLEMRNKGWYAPAATTPGAPLNQAGALTGPAEANGELRGTDRPNGRGRRFNFHGTDEDGEKWVFCNYKNGSLDLRLMYAVPVSSKFCETSEKRTGQRLDAAGIRCE